MFKRIKYTTKQKKDQSFIYFYPIRNYAGVDPGGWNHGMAGPQYVGPAYYDAYILYCGDFIQKGCCT